MMQGTTPTLLFSISNYDLTKCRVYLTIQDEKGLQWTWDSTEGRPEIALDEESESLITIITLKLTQAETLEMSNRVSVQVRWIDAEGMALATEKERFYIRDVLYKEIITFAQEG